LITFSALFFSKVYPFTFGKSVAFSEKMKAGPLSKFEKFLVILMLFRYSVLAVSAFLPLSFPDVWRQVVTLGVSMRYWSRWTVEEATLHPLLPAVLDSGDTQGIMPMEFPILNLATAPFFALGPHLGRAFAILFYNSVMFSLVWVNARIWRGKQVKGIDAFPAMLLLPIFSIGMQWSGKFMPDFLSILLVCISIGLSWTQDRPIRSFLFAALGLLMKPTAVIVYLLFLLHPKKIRKWASSSLWGIPAVGITLVYYIHGISYISQYQELPELVGVHSRSFVEGFVSFFQHFQFISKFYIEKAFFLGGIIPVIAITAWSKRTRLTSFPGMLWLISILQFLLITTIDGGVLFNDHYYYLLGLGPILCFLFSDAVEKCESKALYGILMIGIVVPLLEISLRDLKPLYRSPKESIWTIDQQVSELKMRNLSIPWGQGKKFRSSAEPFPMLGLYFGERSDSKVAPYGFFYNEESFPKECEKIDQTVLLTLAKCR
jgi:hypothetical protein